MLFIKQRTFKTKDNIMINHCETHCKHSGEFLDRSIAKFIRFLKRLHLKEMLLELSDSRDQSKTTYQRDSLLLWTLSVFFFRQESKNALNTTVQDLLPHSKEAFLNYLGIEGKTLPHRTTVDDYLCKINPDEVNGLLAQLFYWCQRSKLFHNHAEKLLPNNVYHIGLDGVWVNTYDIPHAVDANGENSCPYCLPRTINKGTEKEKTYWIHMLVPFIFIFPCGLQLPIFVYPLKSHQVNTQNSDEEIKQECELLALYEVLPKIRHLFPRIPLTLLLDSLYANEPVIELCESLNIGYFIVRQEGSLPSVGKKCDELSECELYQKSYTAQRTLKLKNGTWKEQTIQWFNHVAVGQRSFTNVLRFEEILKDKEGNILLNSKGKPRKVYFEWLIEEEIHQGNCFTLVARARLRQHQEDANNTIKNRGFAAKHDYARKIPDLWLIWKLLLFVGFFIFELFSYTSLALSAKGTKSWKKFAKDLLQQLVEIPWKEIALSNSLQQECIQFRMVFS
jgi:hypothetical protein